MTSNGAHSEMTSPSSPVAPENAAVLTSSPQTVVIKGRRYRQKQLGPAPFASFEDLSDELDSPPETARIPLPGIQEDPSSQLQSPSTPLPQGVNLTEKEEQGLKDALTSSLDTPAPPRIDISRASSSSQHEDSITSSPERENGTHNLGYKEDGTVDLRSSTEELDYIQEPGTVQESEEKRKREKMMKRQQQVRDFCDTQSQHEFMERKDSSCSVMSDVGLLCISGRTSRLSSIGSAASGGSVASGTSHLSAGSHLSGRSTRSPSPHKMLLETSFCGSKPAHTQSAEPEASPALVTLTEKPSSRPPSRLRSRSPSPHKMLLETSFCGTKQMPSGETQKSGEHPEKAAKKSKPKSTTTVVTEAEIVAQKVTVQEAAPKTSKTDRERRKEPAQPEISKPEPIKKVAETVEASKKPKTITFPKKTVSRPKKIISIRDIPGDEIYIPLKGPELDLEEIIRNASPNVKKKTTTEKPEKPASSTEIFIPLHSPPKSSEEREEKEASRQNFDDGIYIPLHSPPKGGKGAVAKKASPQKGRETPGRQAAPDKGRKPRQEPKKREYEVCEDGSIIIPLHSPDEEKEGNDFEREIRRVDEELKRAREAAEKRLREEEKQSKPATLDLSDSASHTSRLSQFYPSAKSDVPSGGSRTPSPGSSLSRKSSFASLFRKSDVFSSPDSQSGSTARKKSGTFSNILKEASDGLRERSRSRSKSRERQPQPSSARSPSGKKNVFTNLFAKKKPEVKSRSGKETDQMPLRLDLQFTFNHAAETGKSAEEGDYIIIPLRDPSDPPDSIDTQSREESERKESDAERPSSPLVILERSESPKTRRTSRESREEVTERTRARKSSSRESVSGGRKSSWEDSGGGERRPEGEDAVGEAEVLRERTCAVTGENVQKKEDSWLPKTDSQLCVEEGKAAEGRNLQDDSSLDLEEKGSKEEIMPVSAGGVRKLKLPPEPGDLEDDHERKGLVYQESFEDELPYVPTTLPLERSVGVKIVPVKHRVSEIKTCPIERPRSTTPINPASLEDYVTSKEQVVVSAEDKMKISLPREDSITSRAKSPRRHSAKGKSWFEFAEAGLQSPRDYRKSSLRTTPSPPPLPPRSSPPSVLSSSAPPTTTSWINFEELPEKRKLPKRITTVPTLRSSADGGEKPGERGAGGVVYSYVSPEDCQCECHDHNASHAKETDSKRGKKNYLGLELEPNGESIRMTENRTDITQGDNEKSECKDCEIGRHSNPERDIEETPLLGVNSDEENDDYDRRRDLDWREAKTEPRTVRTDRDSRSSDFSARVAGEGYEFDQMKPFGMDLEVNSNRSSSISQDDQPSPEELMRSLQ